MASCGIFMWSYMEFGQVVQKEMSIKDISYLELWPPLCSADPKHLCNLGRRYHEEQFCEILLNLDQWFRRNCPSKVFLIWISGSHFVRHSVNISAILLEGIMRNNSVKLFWISVSGSGADVALKTSYLELWQPSCLVEQNLLCNFERGHHREHSCEDMWNFDQCFRRCRLQTFLIWSSGGPFVMRSGIICAILVEGIKRNNSVKLFWIWTSVSGGDAF